MSKHKGGDAQWKLSIEDTGIVRSRLGRGDPYRGALGQMTPTGKKDLRKLGEWIKAKKTVEELKREEAERAEKALKRRK